MFVTVSGIAPTKSDLTIGKGNQAMVGDGHAVSVAAQIVFCNTTGAKRLGRVKTTCR